MFDRNETVLAADHVKAAKVVDAVEQDGGLNRGDTGLVGLELPQTSRLGQEPIQIGLRVPILGAVLEGGVAALERGPGVRSVLLRGGGGPS